MDKNTNVLFMLGGVAAGMSIDQTVDSLGKANQADMIAERLLPRNGTTEKPWGEEDPERRAILESLGFKFGKCYDHWLVKAELPKGWIIKPTEHILYSNVFDRNGYLRGTIMSSMVPWDRAAQFRFYPKFHHTYQCDDYRDPETHKLKTIRIKAQVKDSNDSVVWESAWYAYRGNYGEPEEQMTLMAQGWLEENYPNYEDYTAYWD